MAARLIDADISVSVASVYGDRETLIIDQTIPAGEHGSAVRHVAECRLAELRRGRPAAIAASLSLSSMVAANWEVHGEWEDGTTIRESVIAVARA